MSEFKVWECQVCAWIYDEAKGSPEDGLPPGTRWEDVPEDWLCPECGVGKSDFDMVAISTSNQAGDVPMAQVSTSQTEIYEYSIWECQVCAWVYDESLGWPDDGIAPGTKWQDIHNDWLCPECGVSKSDFEMLEVKRVQRAASVDAIPEAATVPDVEQDLAIAGEVDSSQTPIVIIGSGLAGYNLVKEIRKQDHHTPIHIYTSDDGSFYSKPLLSTGFAKNKSAAELVSQSAEQMAEEFNAEIHIFSTVTSIDTAAKTVHFSNERSQPYSKLVLATGASCIQVPLSGSGLNAVYSVNDLLDYAKFRTIAKHKKKILIMGAGLIGCEYANDLVQAGHEIEVVDPMSTVLASLLPQVASQSVEQALVKAGVTFHFGTVVQSIDSHEGGVLVTLANGAQIKADLVLSAIGVKANTGLANAAGIKTERGIVTDRYLQTSASDVYAIGDCAQVENHLLYYILPLMAQVRALAKTLAGNATQVSYPAMPVIVKTTLFPVVVNPPQRNSDGALVAGEWHIEQASEQGVCAVYKQGDSVLGFALTGDQIGNKTKLERQCPALLS